jgi:glycosyltransferase involved in cell wall biosynthesis
LHSGAGRGARALHEALLCEGVHSHVLGRVESDLPPEFNATPVSLRHRLPVSLANRWYRWSLRRRYGAGLENFHPVSYGLGLHRFPAYRAADIVHIQWANASTFGPAFWRALKHEPRPIIWTLRDMWPLTGGCHVAGDCELYTTGCGRCPQLGGDHEEQVTALDLAFKAAHIGGNVTFVAISHHIAQKARRSITSKKSDIRVIHNSVMLDRFAALCRDKARAALGLPSDQFIVSTGALNLSDRLKGAQVLGGLLNTYRNDPHVHWAIFGQHIEKLAHPVPKNCTFFGPINDDVRLNRIYAAADVFVMPSLQESFGKVTVEAMASGTPVIAFRDTPAEEIIAEGETGWLVPHGDVEAFAAALARARAAGRDVLARMGRTARDQVTARFSAGVIAAKHIELYRELLSRSRPVAFSADQRG